MFLPNLTVEQKAKRYDVLQDSLLEFLEKKIADAKYDNSEMTTEYVLDDWMDEVDMTALLPQDLYRLFDVILDEQYMKYRGLGSYPNEELQREHKEFMKKIEV